MTTPRKPKNVGGPKAPDPAHWTADAMAGARPLPIPNPLSKSGDASVPLQNAEGADRDGTGATFNAAGKSGQRVDGGKPE